jgi:putative ABC transport system permease protein
VPWELLLAAAAVAAWLLLDDAARVDGPGTLGSVAHVPLRLLVAPVLAFVALVILASRVGAAAVRRRETRRRETGRASRRGPGVFLAMRRIARPVAASALLGAVTAVPVALTGFGATVTGSIRLTLEAKSAMIFGAETVATLDRPIDVPPALADRATVVLRLARVFVSGFETDVLGIDPETFDRGAFWHAQLPGPGLGDLVAGLHAGPEPTGITYGVLPAGTHDVKAYGERQLTVSVTKAPLLPGAQGGYPVMLVHKDTLGPAARWALPQLWISGDPATAAAELDRAGVAVQRLAQVSGTFGDSLYEPVTYTFQYLIAVNVFAGLVVAAGLLLYVEARTPIYRRGYVLLRRLGLRRRAHLAALLLETGLPMGVGLLFGLLLAAVAAWTSRADLDLAAGSPPGPLIAVPAGVLVAILGAVVVVAAGSGAFAQYRVARAKPGEVLRGV